MKRELARKGKRPRVLIFGLTETQKSKKEYYEEEINRLKGGNKKLTRRHNMENEERDRRHNAENEERDRRHNMENEERDRQIEELTHRLVALETLRKHFILNCSVEGKVITIVHCRAILDRHHCMNKDCRARKNLLAEL